MTRRIGLAAAWFTATLLSMFIAAKAVEGVGGQVTDRPAALPEITVTTAGTTPADAVPGAPAPRPTSTPEPPEGTVSAGGAATSSTVSATSAPPPPSAPPSVPPATERPSTTAAAVPPPATTPPPPATTTAPPSTTTTAAPATTTTAPFVFSQHEMAGGVVVIRSRPGEVFLVSAVPKSGFIVEVEKSGPESVEVDFEGESYDGELHAEWRDGRLDVDVEERFGDD
jgi:hypothetical protein